MAPEAIGAWNAGQTMLVNSGRAIELGVRAQQTTSMLVNSAAINVQSAGISGMALASNPVMQQNTLDFIDGYFSKGPPPTTPAGYAGAFGNMAADELFGK